MASPMPTARTSKRSSATCTSRAWSASCASSESCSTTPISAIQPGWRKCKKGVSSEPRVVSDELQDDVPMNFQERLADICAHMRDEKVALLVGMHDGAHFIEK